MIRVTSINRKVEVDKGGIATDAACNVVLVAGYNNSVNKARFLLTPDEAEKLDALTKEIEQRIGYLLASDYAAPEPVPVAEIAEQLEEAKREAARYRTADHS